jgi:hypothetical protein
MKFVLALDYMLYAFYDLKLISWPWRVQLQPRENRSEHDILLYCFLAARSTLLKPAQQKLFYIFCQFFNDFSIYNVINKTHTISCIKLIVRDSIELQKTLIQSQNQRCTFRKDFIVRLC